MLEFKTTFFEDVQSVNGASSRPHGAEKNEGKFGCQSAKLTTEREKYDALHLGQPVPSWLQAIPQKMCKDKATIRKKPRHSAAET